MTGALSGIPVSSSASGRRARQVATGRDIAAQGWAGHACCTERVAPAVPRWLAESCSRSVAGGDVARVESVAGPDPFITSEAQPESPDRRLPLATRAEAVDAGQRGSESRKAISRDHYLLSVAFARRSRSSSRPQVCSSGLIPVNWPRVAAGNASAQGAFVSGSTCAKTRLSGRLLCLLEGLDG